MKIKGRGIKLCACGVLKKTCKKHSAHKFCNCGIPIAACEKCRPHIGRCKCGKRRGMCIIHGGWQICPCGSGHHHSRCTVCGSGGKICQHNHRYNNCMTCLRTKTDDSVDTRYLSCKSEICPCGKARKHCNNASCCGGSHLCVTCRMTTTRTKQTECSVCRRFRCGRGPLKQKEFVLKTFIDTNIRTGGLLPYTSHDRLVEQGLDTSLYGANRPDFVWKLSDRWVYLECDENQHKGDNYECERRRELALCNIAAALPVFFIRFNPDVFSTPHKSARVKVQNESLGKRHELLLKTLKGAFEVNGPIGLTFVKLFFDCSCLEPCGYTHTSSYADHESFLMQFQ